MRAPAASAALVAALLLVTGCSSGGDEPSGSTPASSSAPASATPSSSAPTPSESAGSSTPTATATTTAPPAPSPTAAALPAVRSAVSLPALMRKKYDGRGLRVGQVLNRTDSYTRYFVSYLSGSLRISGILNVPRGSGPFRTLVLAHGYIDPAIYTNGRGMMREQDYLARRGYVVLHTDYRNHAQSDDDPSSDVRLRLGYTEDVINAVLALRASGLPYVDKNRIGLMGRSMGGGVVLNVAAVAPGLVDAIVAYAPVSSDTVDNFNKWTRGSPEGDRILAAFREPAQNPTFWRDVSPRTYFSRVTEPIQIQHGTVDESCPIQWSRDTLAALKANGKNAQLITYPGQPHAFDTEWPTSMVRTVAFFQRHLKA